VDAEVTFTVLGAAGFGLAFGSFLNVCILRLPHDRSLLTPPSSCPKCGHLIGWRDNIPVLSWLLLRGRCRWCQAPISGQYPLVEALVAGLWVAAALYYGLTLHALAAALFATILLGIAITDARHYIIPDEFSFGGLAIGLLLSLRLGGPGLVDALIGGAVGFGLLQVVAVVGKWMFKEEAMGGGDIKMMAMVGAFVGWRGVVLTLFGGAVLGLLIFVPFTLKQKRLVPFGVFLAGAAALTFVFGDAVIGWYSHFLQSE
jgi:leader peptidase (prepilin peptidase)/N-methyltransferase